ncbi:MAG: CASTOR/POLLUX-related putative ion channel [Bacteroidales bacterium]
MSDKNHFSFKQRLGYKIEQFLSKGGVSIFWSLFVAFLFSFAIIIAIRAAIVYFGVGFENAEGYNNVKTFWDHIYFIFLQMTDPGNMYQDHLSSPWIKITTILAGTVGVIILSALIAFITTAIDQIMYNFRKGRGQVLEEDFTLILGWSNRVVGIIKELIMANESGDKAVVVIMALDSKEEIDEVIKTSIKNFENTKVVVTHGDPARLNDLDRINAHLAKSVIVMATCEEIAKEEDKQNSDVRVLKTLIAVNTYFEGSVGVPVITEIFDEHKRDLIQTMNNPNIIAIDVWSIIGKLLIQTSLTSGLITVYNEMLSFDGGEIYFYGDPKWEGVKFHDLVLHFEDGIPLGVFKDDKLMLRPELDYVMSKDEEIIIFAEDETTIGFSSEPILNTNSDFGYKHIRLEQTAKRMLFIGWHNVGQTLISEANDYLKDGSVCDVILPEHNQEVEDIINDIDVENTNIKVNISYRDPLIHDELSALEPFSYDVVMVLANVENEMSSDEIDSRTLLISMMLGRMKTELGEGGSKTKLISQVLMSENQELMPSRDLDEFIVSNKYTTMILALLSEEPKMQLFYDDILQEDGSEIYIKRANLYFDESELPAKMKFIDVLRQANKRDEICLGVRFFDKMRDENENFGITLNMAKDAELELCKDDFLVVLAEDDL